MDDELDGAEINERNETLDVKKMKQRDEDNSRNFLRFPYIPMLWVKPNDAQGSMGRRVRMLVQERRSLQALFLLCRRPLDSSSCCSSSGGQEGNLGAVTCIVSRYWTFRGRKDSELDPSKSLGAENETGRRKEAILMST